MTDIQARLLAAIVRDPGCWTARELAGAIDPPTFDRDDYVAWAGRKGDPGRGIEPVVGRVHAHRLAVQRDIGRLQEQGLVERQRPPRLAPWFLGRCLAVGAPEAVRRLQGPPLADGLDWPGDGAPGDDDGDDVDALPDVEPDGNAVLLVRRMLDAQHQGRTLTTRQLLAGASGACRQSYAWLVEEGAVEAPSVRWPTAAGIAAVRGEEE